jgi:phosphate starvation-inducible protein PhoH and related proteins
MRCEPSDRTIPIRLVSEARPACFHVGESVAARRRKSAYRQGLASLSDLTADYLPDSDPENFFDPPAVGVQPAAFSYDRSKKEIAMAKRSAKRRPRAGVLNVQEFQREEPRVRNLQVLEGGYQPANDGARDQRFIKNIRPKSKGQTALMEAIDQHALVLALGPAGTGKTYIAIAKAVEALEAGKVGRIVLSRPAVEAGESLGYLPGAMEDKLAPYLRPLYDALTDRLSAKRLKALMAEGLIEIAPVGFMRGRTLNNAFVVIDEAQNCTYGQIKMLLTRLGWHSTMVVTGDPAQTDLLPDLSGLHTVADKLEAVDNISVIRLTEVDIVRHPLVASMLGVL